MTKPSARGAGLAPPPGLPVDEEAFLRLVYADLTPRLGSFRLRRVRDRATGREGTLREAFVRFTTDSMGRRKRADTEIYIRPTGGGCEWCTAPEEIEFLGETS